MDTTVEPPPLRVRVRPKLKPAAKPKRQPLYAVVLHNDSVNRFEWVIGVIREVVRCGRGRAFWLVLKTHVTGSGTLWSGSLEVAEFKADRIKSMGPDPLRVNEGAKPLQVSVEPLD